MADENEGKSETFRMKVDFPSVLVLAAQDCKAPGITIGFQLAIQSLERIAKRAAEINDTIILEELYHLGLVEKAQTDDSPPNRGI